MPETKDNLPDLLTIDEAAAFLRKGRSSMYRYLKEGRIKGYQVGGAGRLLFKRAELMDLLVPVEPSALQGDGEEGSEPE